MNHTAIPPAATIRARVHQSALKRVTKLYSSSLSDVFTETLQNARRSGATRVRVTVGTATGHPGNGAAKPSETPLTVTVTDDGAGIADPASATNCIQPIDLTTFWSDCPARILDFLFASVWCFQADLGQVIVTVRATFQLPTSLDCRVAPRAMSFNRESPRHMTMLPGGGSCMRAR